MSRQRHRVGGRPPDLHVDALGESGALQVVTAKQPLGGCCGPIARGGIRVAVSLRGKSVAEEAAAAIAAHRFKDDPRCFGKRPGHPTCTHRSVFWALRLDRQASRRDRLRERLIFSQSSVHIAVRQPWPVTTFPEHFPARTRSRSSFSSLAGRSRAASTTVSPTHRSLRSPPPTPRIHLGWRASLRSEPRLPPRSMALLER